MNLKQIDLETDYDILIDWWKQHDHWAIPKTALSSVGLMAYNEKNEPIAASWLYVMAGSTLGQIGWTVSNPKAGLRERYKGVSMLVDGLIEAAKYYKRTELIVLSSSNGLNKMLEKRKFVSKVKHDLYVGDLCQQQQ